jgi:hypothetical protein
MNSAGKTHIVIKIEDKEKPIETQTVFLAALQAAYHILKIPRALPWAVAISALQAEKKLISSHAFLTFLQ